MRMLRLVSMTAALAVSPVLAMAEDPGRTPALDALSDAAGPVGWAAEIYGQS